MNTETIMVTSLVARMRGLLGVSKDFQGQIMLIPCCDIHTYCMADPLDVAFVDAYGYVVASYRNVMPKSRYRVRDARCVIERYACPEKDWYCEGDNVIRACCEHKKKE